MPDTIVVTEKLNNGLVTSRDRSLLQPGELARCNNAIYAPNDDAIFTAPGRVLYNSGGVVGAPDPILGLRYLRFEGANALLAEYHVNGGNGKIATSTFTGETGTWTDYSASLGVGASLESVFFRNRHALLYGAITTAGDLVGPGVVVKSTGIGRRFGLAATMSAGTVASAAGAGWPNSATFPLGWYAFFSTEVHDPEGPDELESAFDGPNPAIINVSNAANGVLYTFPSLVNTGKQTDGTNLIAAHRLYMSGPVGGITPVPSSQPPNPPLSSYVLVAEVDIAAANTTIGIVSLSNGKLPGTASGWTNPNNIKTDDNVGATTSTNSAVLIASNYGFAATAPTGIAVEIKLKYTNPFNITTSSGITPNIVGNAHISLTKNASTATGNSKTIPLPGGSASTAGSYQVFTLGGPGELWGGTFTGAEAAAAGFGALVTAQSFVNSGGVDVDYVRIYVYTAGSGSTIPIGKAYDVVVVSIGGALATVYSANSEPPGATTGDIFEDQFVCNDIANERNIRYSVPAKHESFPSPYYVNFEEADKVTCVRTLGDVLLVGLQRQLWRVLKLPRGEDPNFDRGRVKEPVASDKGVVSVHAITNFTVPGKPEMAAFVSLNGIHYTDGFHVDTLTEDLDWTAMVNVSKLDKSFLVNYPKLYVMAFHYIPADDSSSTYPTKRLWLHYHPSHIRRSSGMSMYYGIGGKLKVTGPCNFASVSGTVGALTSGYLFLTGCTDGNTYVEDRGHVESLTGANVIMDLVTRDLYPCGVGYEFTCERVWWRHYKSVSPAVILLSTPWVKKTGGDYFTPAAGARWTGKARDSSAGAQLAGDIPNLNNSGALERTDQHLEAESVAWQFTTSDTNNGFGLSYIAFDAASRGLSESHG